MKAIERLLALLLFVLVLPTILVAILALRSTSTEPVFLTDEVMGDNGTALHSYRLRTTGPGTRSFRAIGRTLRRFAIDELPGLWAVVEGRLGLRQFINIASIK